MTKPYHLTDEQADQCLATLRKDKSAKDLADLLEDQIVNEDDAPPEPDGRPHVMHCGCRVFVGEGCAIEYCRLHDAAIEMHSALKALLAWQEVMGGWDSRPWREAEAAVAKVEGKR
jgi:hypothetical protein